jgi:activator of HSP90 ATPase
MSEKKVVGLTKKVGFQFSIIRTQAVSTDAAWDFLLSEKGVSLWLGKFNFDDFELNNTITTDEGIEAKITIFKADSHLRLAWKPAHWVNNSFIEIRVFEAQGRAKIGLLHTHMMDAQQRAEVKDYWGKVFQEMGVKLAKYGVQRHPAPLRD